MSEIKLKPCPFCGGEAKIQHGGNGGKDMDYRSFVKCEVCGALGAKFRISTTTACDVEAAKAWNRE